MKRLIITTISATFYGLVVLSACGGAKKNVQDAEGQAGARGDVPGGYLMPAIPANSFCGDFITMTPGYGYLIPEEGLSLKMHGIRGIYGINIYTYMMDGDNVQCTPGHSVMIVPRNGDKLEIIIKKSSMKNVPSFTFIPTPDCENSAYVATEKVAGKYYCLCGDVGARYKFEDLFEDGRCAEFKNSVDNYGKQLNDY